MTNFILQTPKAVFIHLPKTGGTSVQKAMGVERRFFGHVPDDYKDLLHFSIVRDPKTRFLSAFRMFKYGNQLDADYYSEPKWPELTVSKALDVLDDPWVGFDRSARNLKWNLKHHIIPQTHPFNCLALARHVLRFETLEDDFEDLCAELECSVALPKLRQSKGAGVEDEAWSAAEEARFFKVFENDYNQLDYEPHEAHRKNYQYDGTFGDAFSLNETVYSLWSAYFSDRKIKADAVAEALPKQNCILEPFADEIIPGKPGSTWAGRSGDLIKHFHKLQPEFAGASRLSHLLACTIVAVRKNPKSECAIRLFWRIIDEQFDVIRSELSLRWLVAISDTITDFGRDPTEQAIGMNASVFANSTKLHESELMVFYPKRPWPPKRRYAAGGELFDGMITYWTEKGDLVDNMFSRSEKIAQLSPSAGKVLIEVTERLRNGPTVYRRFARIFGASAVPLIDSETKQELQRIIKENL